MAGKPRAKAADKGQVGRADLACLGKRSAGCQVDQDKAAASGREAQTPIPQQRLQRPPTLRLRQNFSDEKPKAHEEPLIDAFGTLRFAALAALHL
jgi:hypothetical protein